jgi:hypothetical protein
MSINKTCTRRIFLYVALVFAVFAAIQPQLVNAKNPVTRQITIASQYTILDFGYDRLPWAFYEEGVASHIGHFHSVAKYVADAQTGFYGFGILFAANGDQIFFEQPGSNVVYFTGGTGRFQEVKGEITYTMTSSEMVEGPPGTWRLTGTYTAVGTITYND